MQETELFLSMAEIAGVFVGFGALIATRTDEASDSGQLSSIRWVVTIGIWVVVVALLPIILSRFGVGSHQLWLVTSLVALVLFALMNVVNGRAPENLADLAATVAARPRAEILLVMGPTFWLPTILLVLGLALVVLDVIPDQEQAAYLAALGLGLFMGAIHLFVMVFWGPWPKSSSPGGPSRGGRAD